LLHVTVLAPAMLRRLLDFSKNMCNYVVGGLKLIRLIKGGLGWGSGEGTALLVGKSGDRSPVVSLGTFSEATDGTICPGVESASKK
jgi:hypothetical protein